MYISVIFYFIFFFTLKNASHEGQKRSLEIICPITNQPFITELRDKASDWIIKQGPINQDGYISDDDYI